MLSVFITFGTNSLFIAYDKYVLFLIFFLRTINLYQNVHIPGGI